MSPPIHFAHELGQLEGRLAALEQKIDGYEQRAERRLHSIETKIDELGAALNFGRGGWKVLVIIAAITGTLLTFIKEVI